MYSDEDKIDAAGVRRTPIFKAAFDFDLHFTGHLSAYAVSTLRAAAACAPALKARRILI